MDIAIILTKRFSDSEWTLAGDDYEGLTWLSETTKPTKESLESLWASVESEINAENKAKLDAKVSAVAKLKALGLTVQEVEVAFGLTE